MIDTEEWKRLCAEYEAAEDEAAAAFDRLQSKPSDSTLDRFAALDTARAKVGVALEKLRDYLLPRDPR